MLRAGIELGGFLKSSLKTSGGRFELAHIASLSAQSRNRTSDTRIFSPLLYQLSYLSGFLHCKSYYTILF